MMSADDCRELAKWYRARAEDDTVAPTRAAMLKKVAHSLSSLATQLETTARDAHPGGASAYQDANTDLSIAQPPRHQSVR
jgi:hypothetical protein